MMRYRKDFERRKIAVLDVDNTLAEGFFIFKFPIALVEKKLFEPEKLDNMNSTITSFLDGKISYFDAGEKIQDCYAKGITNQRQIDILNVGFNFVKQNPEFLFSYSKELIEMLKNYGYVVILESGSPLEVIFPFGELIGADLTFATTYETKKGIFTGKWECIPTLNERKQRRVKKFIKLYNSNIENSIGFGDSYLDFDFIRELGKGVIISPKKELLKTIKDNQWLICEKEDKVLEQVKELLNSI